MVGAVVGLVALLVTLVAFIAAAGHAGYLAMITAAARRRAGGSPAIGFVKKRAPVAGATLGITLVALLIASGGSVPADIVAILLGGGGGLASMRGLQSTHTRFRKGLY